MSTALPWGTRKAGLSTSQTPSSLMVGGYPTPNSQSLELESGAYAVGLINDEERFDVVRHSCPGAGACGGMYTYVFCRF